MEEKIIDLAAAGVPNAIIANTVGCDPSYVTQVLGTERAQERVGLARAEKAAQGIEHDAEIETAEKTALEKVLHLLPHQTDLMKVTRVFQVLNAAKRSNDHGMVSAGQQPGSIVTLNLPAVAQVHFKLTTDQQVIEVEGRSMVPMQSQNVAKRLKELQTTRLLASSIEMPNQAVIGNRTKSIAAQL